MELPPNSIARYSYGLLNWLIGLSVLIIVILAPLYLLHRNKRTRLTDDDGATHGRIATQQLQQKPLVHSQLADFDHRDISPQQTLDDITTKCNSLGNPFLATLPLSDSNEGAYEKLKPFLTSNSVLQSGTDDDSMSVVETTAIDVAKVKLALSTHEDTHACVDSNAPRSDEINESQALKVNEDDMKSPEAETSKLPNANIFIGSASRSISSINKTKPKADHIEQQRQTYIPTYKSRCEFWPHCTNKSCKYYHPFTDCR